MKGPSTRLARAPAMAERREMELDLPNDPERVLVSIDTAHVA